MSGSAVSPASDPPPIAPGAHIELRDTVWRVVRVDPTSSGMAAWRCVGVSEIVKDQEAIFLEELEPGVRVLDPRTTALERDTSAHHRAGLLYMESLLRDVPPPDDALYVGQRAAMDLLDFQLRPAWMALEKPRQRILIADTVGLGKTLEAGILLSELIRRGRARRILVAATKAMLTQFQKEMWGRFTIPLVRLDSLGLQRIRSDIPTHHNPFYYFDRAIISIDTLKQNNWFRTHVEQAYWDVIVVDEAHNVATRGGGQSQRARIAELLASRCDSLVLLSATPHDGKARSFASLMNMLDPTAIADPDNYTKEDIQGLFVRRFKHEVADELKNRIPERRMVKAHAEASPAEECAFEALSELSFTRIDQRAHGGLLFRTTLEKALLSSPMACLQTVQNRIKRLQKHEKATEYAADIEALEDLAHLLQTIDADDFSKYQKLLELLRGPMAWKPRKPEDRLVIFTERRKTQDFLRDNLTRDFKLKPGQCLLLDGSMPDHKQQDVVEAFGKQGDKVRLLIATDVAAEGINLHYLSHRLVHFDVPWSLMVFQQRNGRIDRYGQELEPQILYLLTNSACEKIKGDARILDLLIERDDQANRNIGDPSAFMNVYDVDEEELITGRAMEQEQSPEAFDSKLEATLQDPFALMLGGAADNSTEAPPTSSPTGLFASDFDFFSAAVDRLRETEDLRADLRPADRLAELHMTPDLERRFRKLPREVRPDDGVILLTADPDRMQLAINEARREEDAWPRHQYLWANSPILSWLGDRLRAAFGRHTAPVLLVGDRLAPDDTVVVVSGLLPNHRGQPLVHRWYAACFQGDTLDRVEPFAEVIRRADLGGAPLPNASEPVDQDALKALLPTAVEAVGKTLAADRDAFRARLEPRLKQEQQRLMQLQDRQLDFLDHLFEDRHDTLAVGKKETRQARVKRTFREHKEWVEDAMTTADEPFLQVISVLVRSAT